MNNQANFKLWQGMKGMRENAGSMTCQQGVWGVCMEALCGMSVGVGIFLSPHAAAQLC